MLEGSLLYVGAFELPFRTFSILPYLFTSPSSIAALFLTLFVHAIDVAHLTTIQ